MELLDSTTLAALFASLALLLAAMLMRRRQAPAPAPRDETLDTVQAWPPQAVRVMTLGERQAYEILRRARALEHWQRELLSPYNRNPLMIAEQLCLALVARRAS